MAQQPNSLIENNFTKGLITEFTGLNFPENAATDCDNTEFSIIGNVKRRLGVDFETGYTAATVDRTNKAVNSYKWNNAGGDGSTQVVVSQVGNTLYFWLASQATGALSPTKSASTVTVSSYVGTGITFDATACCEFSDGNGYLFVFHPSCDPFYVVYSGGVFTAFRIDVTIRDLVGVPEIGIPDNLRPSALTVAHNYNLVNQGWISGNPWATTSTTSNTPGVGAKIFTVPAGLSGITPGQGVIANGFAPNGGNPRFFFAGLTGTVTSYVGTTLTLSISGLTLVLGAPASLADWDIVASGSGYLGTWVGAVGSYPSNADQWWRFKNPTGVFDPVTTQPNTTLGSGPAPKGHVLLNAFTQYRTAASGAGSVTDITTTARPTNGCWFQGRVFYTGVNGSFAATGTAPFTTWTGVIYFSQVVFKTDDFGKCYSLNDQTSQDFFDLLPTDGGTISIPESGAIYKLFPTANGLLVFAANGIWFITGSQGIGFSATDYTKTHISGIKCISPSSFVDVNGLPYFWNEEGIYSVQPKEGGGLSVDSMTVTTVASFYDEIPLTSKRRVRGVYHPIEYVIQWIYTDTEAASTTAAYSFDRILNYNVYNKAFYPYSIDNSDASINGIVYLSSPGGTNAAPPTFKYVVTQGTNLSFGDQHDTSYVDWRSVDVKNYESFFTTGYRLHGQAQRRFQMPYLYFYSAGGEYFAYKIQGIWDYATTGNTGRWSALQLIESTGLNYGVVSKRHRIRGRGLVLQFKVTSKDGAPFDIIGWSAFEALNTGV